MQQFRPELITAIVLVLILSIFGLFHFGNVLGGKSISSITPQVIHAAAMGFLYATLRLRIGAIWPLMLMHGFWDFSLFVLQTSSSAEPTGASQIVASEVLMIAAPALLYGVFVYWRWSKMQINA